ncbi:MAG: ribose 5-phosphate isomerase B [Cyanobacteria bacterium REEB65]|nr:ribose 5-phosphate isomerase B [Cyanobacteria bacterium REEB65]
MPPRSLLGRAVYWSWAKTPKETTLRVAIGSDHAGFFLKEAIEGFLEQEGCGVIDLGCDSPDPVDYPDFARQVAERVARKEVDRGILVCGSGIGMSMAANKVPGARAALVSEPLSARLGREHNDANVLCLGARLVGEDMARECVRAFLGAEFAAGRHQRRVEQLAALDAVRHGKAES